MYNALDESAQSKVHCKCDKVQVTLQEAGPRCQFECACIDCRQRLEWAKTYGADTGSWAGAGVHNCHFGNCIISVVGEENLKTYKLNEKTGGTLLVAECCKTFLLMDHDGYEAKVFCVQADCVNFAATKDPIILNETT